MKSCGVCYLDVCYLVDKMTFYFVLKTHFLVTLYLVLSFVFCLLMLSRQITSLWLPS